MKKDNLNSNLSKIKLDALKIGFKVPENYFNSIEDIIFEKLSFKILPKKNKKNEFKTPNNYFNTIEDNVLAELKIQKLLNGVNNNFKVPNKYFDSVENKTIRQYQLEKKIDNRANPFEITAHYFDNLEKRVLSKINNAEIAKNKNEKEIKIISIRKKILKYLPLLATAASLVLIFSLEFNSQKITFDSLENSDIENLINTGVIDIDAYKIALLYPDIKLDISNNLSNDEMADYLSKQDIGTILTNNQ